MKKTKNIVLTIVSLLAVLILMIVVSTIQGSSYDRSQKIKQYGELYTNLAALKFSKQSEIKKNFKSVADQYVKDGKYSQDFIDKQVTKDTEEVSGRCMSDFLGIRNDLPINVTKTNNETLEGLLDTASKSVSNLESVNESTCKDLFIQQLDSYKEEYAKEVAFKKQQEESSRKYEANRLSLDKFNNKIKSGMSLNSVKNVFLFDNYCELSTESNIAGYSGQIYTCKDFDNGIATFQFQNGRLIAKSQLNLK